MDSFENTCRRFQSDPFDWQGEFVLASLVHGHKPHAVFVAHGSSRVQAELRRLCNAVQPGHCLNLSLALSKALLEIRSQYRPAHIHNLLNHLLDGSGTFLLENIELLFDASLRTDPVRLLKLAGRNKRLVISWPGRFEQNCLLYAEPDHPEYRRYDSADLADITVVDASTLRWED